jgi:hypothetical protein
MAFAKFQDQTVPLTASFVAVSFGFKADNWTLINDDISGTNQVAWSYDGVNTHGMLKAGEAMSYDSADTHTLSLKYINGAPSYRLIANGAF